MREVGIQLYITSSEALEEEVTPVVNDPEGYFRQKPLYATGFWTSSWREKSQDSDWVEWCRGENFSDPDGKLWYLLTPQTDCKLYTIRSLKGFNRCLMEYGYPAPVADLDPIFAAKRVIDFEKLALEFDGIRLTERGNEQTHLSYPNDLNAWDCESTLWFRWCFASVQAIPTPALDEVSA